MRVIYNRQELVSEKTGKTYIGRGIAYNGRAGKPSEAQTKPPFYVRITESGKQTWYHLKAQSLADAKVEAEKMEDTFRASAAGVAINKQAAGMAKDSERGPLVADLIENYLAEVEDDNRASTLDAYRRSLTLFKSFAPNARLNDVDRALILKFKTFLRNQKRQDNQKHFAERTAYNHFLNVATFFKNTGRDFKSMGVRLTEDGPEKKQRKPEEYSVSEINALLKHVRNERERLILQTFLYTGLRDQELAHLEYRDVDCKFSSLVVRAKPHRNWEPKTEAAADRHVPVPPALIARIQAWRKREIKSGEKSGVKDSDLIFPNKDGEPDQHFLRIVKRAAKKARLEGRVNNHKFRSTAITLWLRGGNPITDIMEWVGHEASDTITENYAAKAKVQNPEVNARATASFPKLDAM
jgi:integrase